MQELLENLTYKEKKIKKTIVGEKEIYEFSQPISKTQCEELCNYKENGFHIEKNKNYLKISSKNSKIIIFLPYFRDDSDRIIYFVKNIKIHAILPVFTIIGIFALGFSYLKLSADFTHLRIINLLPIFLSSTSKSLLIFGALMPYLMSLMVLGIMGFINFMNLKLYHLIQPTTFKSFFCIVYFPFLLMGLILPLLAFFICVLHLPSSNQLYGIILCLPPLIPIISSGLKTKNKKINVIDSILYSSLSSLVFYAFVSMAYFATLISIGSNHNFWITFGVSLLPAFLLPLSTLTLTILLEYPNQNATPMKNKTKRIALPFSSWLSTFTIILLIFYAIFDSINIFKVTGIGEYYENIYVNKDLSQYKSIINNLNYDKKTNEIKPWVILQTPSLIVMSKSKDNQPLYVFRRFPYELMSIITPKISKKD